MDQGRGEPIAYWRASERLAPYVTGYHRFDAPLPPGVVLRDVLFPSWATIRVTLPDSRDWSLRLGSRRFDPVPDAVFIGATSYAGYVETKGGALCGVGILPTGWAALFGGDASLLANRAVPLSSLVRDADALVDAIHDGEAPDAAFERWLAPRIGRHEPDPRIAQLLAIIEGPAEVRIEQLTEMLAMPQRSLADFTRRHFGFTPKLLLRRSRFVHALSAVLAHPEDGAAVLEQAGYWDRSHFLRDSHQFLGCSVREFLKRRGPLNPVALKVRAEVIGAAV